MPLTMNIIGKRAAGKTTFIAEYVKRNTFDKVIFVSPLLYCSNFCQLLPEAKNIIAIPPEMLSNVLSELEFNDSLLIIFDDVYEQNLKKLSKIKLPINASVITTYQAINPKMYNSDYTVIFKIVQNREQEKIYDIVKSKLKDELLNIIKNMGMHDVILVDNNNAKINYFPTSEYGSARFDSISRALVVNSDI